MNSPRKPAHYFEIQIDTRRNMPEIINGKGEDMQQLAVIASNAPEQI